VAPRFACDLITVFDRRGATTDTDDLGEHRAVVTGAGAELQHALAGLEVIEVLAQKLGMPLLRPRGVNRHQHIVIESGGIIALARHRPKPPMVARSTQNFHWLYAKARA
jgi:hypothetical protein